MYSNFKNTIYNLIIIIVLMVMAFGAGWYVTRGQAERWQENFRAERDSIFMEMRNDQMLYHAQTVSITRAEFQDIYEMEYDLLKKMGLKQPQQLTNLETVTTYHVETTLRDSVIRDTVAIKVMDYRDKNISIQAAIEADTIRLDYLHFLSLKLVLSKQPRDGFKNKILLRPWVRPLQATAIPNDEHTKIVKLETIVIK